jgi:hypothetical protein
LSCAGTQDAAGTQDPVELEIHPNSSPWTELAMNGTEVGLKEYGNFSSTTT